MKKVIGLLIFAGIFWTSYAGSVFSVSSVVLEEIKDGRATDTVTMLGHTDLETITIKVLRPNQSILYMNVVKGGDFSDSFTLPDDSAPGTYTVIAGSGDDQNLKKFQVIAPSHEEDGEDSGGGTFLAPAHPTLTLKPVIQNGIASVQPEAGHNTVLIAVKDFANMPLKVLFHDVYLSLGPSEVQALLTRAADKEGAVLQVKAEAAASTETGRLIRQNGAQLQMAGKIFDVTLTLITKDGTEIRAVQLAGDTVLSLPYDPKADERLLGIYYRNENTSQWEYVGGTVDTSSERIQAKLEHLSSYAAISYKKSFDDVPSSHWANRTLELLASRHIVSGITENLFRPDDPTTRAEFTAMLVRLLELPTGGGSTPFSDVSADAWYADPIQRAYAAGLISGLTDTEFAPDAAITREQMAMLLVKAYEARRGSLHAGQAPQPVFKDADQISGWAREAVYQASALKLMQGIGEGMFDAQSAATRSQNAQAIYNLMQNLKP
ncbi:S-layer homology domain-containing protein [Paenibacillus sp. GCM10023248]|uniref:S-layer homology domain-containing protein n=1 Tax=unclassified Paenibacillus TaxID=185978 RepID=UPI002379BAA4|nr:S-layer homology domain-containing protein [Paenibacillus sp. MAHUQ-63]MDD9268436.1 S-layer homology domain-containing protein [Paenibacillus sp. MAHUQ-63]